MASSTRRRAWLRWIAALSAILAAALVVGYVEAGRRATAAVHAAIREASRRLGRPVTARSVAVRLLPTIEVTVIGLTVGAAPGGVAREALLEVASVRASIGLVALVRSGGHDVVVEAFEVREPRATVVILPGGHHSLEDLQHRAPAPPREAGRLRSLRVARASVTRGALRLLDRSDSHEEAATVESLDATVTGLGPDRGATAVVTAGLLGAARNGRATVSLGRLLVDRGGAPVAPAVGRVELALDDVALAPALRVAAKHRPLRLLGGAVRGTCSVALDERGRPSRVTAALRFRALVLRRREGGERPPVEASADADVALDAASDVVDVARLEVTLDGMSLGGSARVARGVGAPEVRSLTLASRAVTLEALEPWLPADAVPRGASLSGPVAFTASGRSAAGGGAQVDLALDLGAATVEVPSWVHKPAGTALSARFVGLVRGRDVSVERLGVTLGPLAAHAHGEVRSAERFDLSFDTGDVPIDPLLRLLPGVRGRVPAGVTLRGQLRASGELRAEGTAHAARARLALRGADVRTEALSLAGDADASFGATVAARSWEGSLRVDAGRARVTVPGRIDKPAGAPLLLTARGRGRGRRTELGAVSALFPGARVEGRGSWDAAARRANLTVPVCELDLARLLPALPAAASRVPRALASASTRFAAAFEGGADELATAHLRLDGLDLRSDLGRLHGSLDVTGLDRPRRVRFELAGDVLDATALTRSAHESERAAPAWARDADVEGSLRADVLRTPSVTFASPRVSLRLQAGRLTFSTLTFGAVGGAFRGDGTAVDLGSAVRRVDARVAAEHVDLFLLGAATGTEPARRANGSLDLTANLTAEGADGDAMRASLDGRLHLSGVNVVVQRLVNPTVSVTLPLLGSRPSPRGSPPRDPTRPMLIRRFDAPLRAERGAFVTAGPVTADTDAGAIRLTGRVGVDHTLALAGRITLPPEAVERMTHGARLPSGDVPVSIRVTGTTDAPRVEVDDLSITLGALVGSRLRAIGRDLLR